MMVYLICENVHIIKLMINNKSASKTRKKPEKIHQNNDLDVFDDHNN
jgi:hypothetical protein